jgi:hypothetical protein
MHLKVYIFLLSTFLLLFSCAIDKPIKTTTVSDQGVSGKYYLPGVDSSVAKNAIQFSDRIIVDYNKRKTADFCYEKGMNSLRVADSLWTSFQKEQRRNSNAIQLYLNWIQQYNPDYHNTQIVDESKFDKLDQVCLTVLDSAYKEAAKAKFLNPYNLDVRSLLIKIYLKQGEITHDGIYYTRAIDELNNFLLVDKSNPYIYEKLGECFYALKDWENCYRFFSEAEEILKIISRFKYEADQKAEASLDTARWIYYLRRQGEAKAKLYDSERAISYLTKAKELSASDDKKQEIQDFLNWINWDGGNIRAAEIRDEILKIENSNDYKRARADYIELLKILRTQKARNEINWKIASIEYNLLGRKNEALKRLFQVIQNIKKSNQNHPFHTVYLKDYAAMCYSVGMEHFSKNRFRLAFIYLNQASQIDWEHKGDCYFQLAVLSCENPAETIRNCKIALNYSHQLSENKIKKIYGMLAVSYKRKGEFDIAHTYFQNLINHQN